MKRLLVILALCLSSPVLAQDWIDALDAPLMPGLSLQPDRETVFEAPGGRIVEVVAGGTVAPEAARRYYADALAGLGWQGTPETGLRRGAEALNIEIIIRDGRTVVAFRLTPIPAQASTEN